MNILRSVSSNLLAFLLLSLAACSATEDTPEAPTPSGDATHEGPGSSSSSSSSSSSGGTKAGPVRGACLDKGQCEPKRIADGLGTINKVAASSTGVWALNLQDLVHIAPNHETVVRLPPGIITGAPEVAAVGDMAAISVDRKFITANTTGKTTLTTFDTFRGTPTSLRAVNGEIYFLAGNEIQWSKGSAYLLSYEEEKAGSKPIAATVDADGMYWALLTMGGVTLMTFDQDTRKPLGFVPKAETLYGFVTTKTHIVFHDYAHRRILAFAKNGDKKMIVVAENDEDAFEFAADDDGVYWRSWKGLMACNPDATNVRVLVPGVYAMMGGVSVTKDTIYYGFDGGVYALAK